MAHAHCMLEPKAINIYLQYLILIASPLQLLHERASMLGYMYIACLVFYFLTTSMVYVLHCDVDSQSAVLGLSNFIL